MVDEATGQSNSGAVSGGRGGVGGRKGRKRRRRRESETGTTEEPVEEIPVKKVRSMYIGVTHWYLCVFIVLVELCLMQQKKWKNKQRVLVFCARGITYRYLLPLTMASVCR